MARLEVVSPHVVGEFALLTPEHSRTQTLEWRAPLFGGPRIESEMSRR
jgi:hypothetical protein